MGCSSFSRLFFCPNAGRFQELSRLAVRVGLPIIRYIAAWIGAGNISVLVSELITDPPGLAAPGPAVFTSIVVVSSWTLQLRPLLPAARVKIVTMPLDVVTTQVLPRLLPDPVWENTPPASRLAPSLTAGFEPGAMTIMAKIKIGIVSIRIYVSP
jgi:hypothetical protein